MDVTGFSATLSSRRTIAGRYEVLSRLGKGGMSEVWHAHDLKLRMDVALKSVRVDRERSEESMEALRQEVRSARDVISPNVCRIFDLVVEQEQELISMEYIDGITLMQLLVEKGPLLLSEATDIAAQFLSGLEAIHHSGLVHCDLKPENIMITRTGRVVVMDLGIARQVRHAADSISGTLPYMSPEQLSGSEVDARSDLFAAGVVLAEMIHSQRILSEKTREGIWDAVHENPLQLADSPWKDVIARALSQNRENRFLSAGALARALEDATQHSQVTHEECPYPGLASFTSADSQNFFGRELDVETVLKQLQQVHMLALIGTSGAGKTSFLRAGLMPSLPEGWSSIFCAPGDSPAVNLGQALVPELSKNTEAMQKMLQFEDPAIAVQFLYQWRMKHTETLLIIDRFEELFTLNAPEVQSRFADLLTRAVLEADVRVLLCMRDDFLIFCHDHAQLDPFFSGLTPLGALKGPNLRRALVQPALKCGYRFQDETLVDEILSDVENERGALPLMAFAAARLWAKRDRQSGELTRAAYQQIGGVGGALAKHAEETMDRIGAERQEIVREIFRNLVTAENTRAARDTEELLTVFPEKSAAEEVLRILIDARLLTSFEAPAEEGKKARRRVEIIHESLLSAWPRLVRWQTQDADSAQLRDQLRQAAQLWDQRGRSEDLLWTGTAVLEFRAWRERYPGGLTINEEAFARSMAQKANSKQRQRRIAFTTIFVVLLGFLVVISSFWRKATVARDDAVSETRRAEAGRVLTVGRSKSDADPSTKLAYALAGLELADSTEGRHFALQSLSEGSPAQIVNMQLHTIDFSPDGRWMAGSAAGGVYLFPRDGKTPITVNQPDAGNFYTLWNTQFSPDGEFLLFSWRKDLSIVKVWSVSQKKVIRTLDMEGITLCLVRGETAYLITDTTGGLETSWSDTIIRTWRFDSNQPEVIGGLNLGRIGWKDFDIDSRGRSIVYKKSRSIYIRPLDAKIGPEKLVGTHAADIEVVRFHPNSNEIASSDMTGEIRLWSLVPGIRNPVRVIAGNGPRKRLWFDPKGSFLLAPGENALLRWDLSVPESEPLAFRYQDEDARWVTFDPEGRWMAVAGPSTIAFYNLTDKHPYVFNGSKYSGPLQFMPDGKSIVNGDDVIKMHDIFGQKQPTTRDLLILKRSSAQSFAIDPSGKYLFIGTAGSGVHLVSIADGKEIPLKGSRHFEFYQGVAISRDGKSVAASRSGKPEDSWIEIWDLESGNSRILEQSKGKSFHCLKYSPDGNSLFSGADGNLYQWNLKDNSHKVLHIGNRWVTSIAISNNGRYVAASSSTAASIFDLALATSSLVLYDLKEGKSFPIVSHGNRVWCVSFDFSGTKLLTGDLDGIVRVGPINGDAHLLVGHKGSIGTVLVHPDGKWISSADDRQTIRLWPMPEGKRFLVIPHTELVNRLRTLTNVRAVADKTSSTGYRIDYSPFPGWEKASAR